MAKRPNEQDVLTLNRAAWDHQSSQGDSRWVQPVSPEEIAAARRGQWEVILTPTKNVPKDWFGDVKNKALLGLAASGGQQVPILSAAGAQVTSFDNSPVQLSKDRFVAEREGLNIRFEQGDMADLSRFADCSFDIIFHPVSNVFAPNITTVWQACARILKPNGHLLSGFMNPDFFLFDHEKLTPEGALEVKFELPYSDLTHLTDAQIQERVGQGQAIEFSHSLDDQIGGQINAGFAIAGFYEDRWSDADTPLNRFMPTSMATLAIKT